MGDDMRYGSLLEGHDGIDETSLNAASAQDGSQHHGLDEAQAAGGLGRHAGYHGHGQDDNNVHEDEQQQYHGEMMHLHPTISPRLHLGLGDAGMGYMGDQNYSSVSHSPWHHGEDVHDDQFDDNDNNNTDDTSRKRSNMASSSSSDLREMDTLPPLGSNKRKKTMSEHEQDKGIEPATNRDYTLGPLLEVLGLQKSPYGRKTRLPLGLPNESANKGRLLVGQIVKEVCSRLTSSKEDAQRLLEDYLSSVKAVSKCSLGNNNCPAQTRLLELAVHAPPDTARICKVLLTKSYRFKECKELCLDVQGKDGTTNRVYPVRITKETFAQYRADFEKLKAGIKVERKTHSSHVPLQKVQIALEWIAQHIPFKPDGRRQERVILGHTFQNIPTYLPEQGHFQYFEQFKRQHPDRKVRVGKDAFKEILHVVTSSVPMNNKK